MKKYILLLAVCLYLSFESFSQYDVEALKYSQKFLQSDARSVGIGNAFGAVGANIVSSSINPAGLAIYRSSELSISTSFNNTRTENQYLGGQIDKSKFNVSVPQFGLVFSKVNKKNGKEVTNGWSGFAFGFGVIKTNNFNTRYHYSGLNQENSILDFHVESANGRDINSFGNITGLYWDAYLINPNNSTNDPYDYISAIDTSLINMQINQNSTLTTKGSMYDINFTFAGNYSNRIYLGGNISFPTLNYRRTSEFSESNLNPNRTNYVSSNHRSTLDVNGNGINAGFGILIKPSKFFRFGGSIYTPTYYWLSEDFRETVRGVLDTLSTTVESFGNYDYNVTTPMRATASVAFFFDKYGFISLDYDFVDYSSTFFDSDDYAFTSENQAIENNYGTANNIRVGMELKYEIFAIRGGYSLYGSPYKSEAVPADANGETEIFALGFGIREKAYYIDLAYQISNRTEYYLPYSLTSSEVQGGTSDYKNTNILLTLGLRF